MDHDQQQNEGLVFSEGYDTEQDIAIRFQNSALRELKSAVLAIDWEITDSILLKFSEEVHDLQDALQGDSYSLLLLQILDALGKYIRVKLANAHPMSIHILQSSYDTLEEFILGSGDSSDDFKKRKVSKVVADYKKLKAAIRQGASANGNGSGAKAQPKTEAPGEPRARCKDGSEETQKLRDEQPNAAPHGSTPLPVPSAAPEGFPPELQALLAGFRSVLREELQAFRQEMRQEIAALRAPD